MNIKAKGRSGEHEVAMILQEAADEVCSENGWGRLNVERNLEQTRSELGNARGSDLTGLPWFGFEVKRVESEGGWTSWWEQCRSACWVWTDSGTEVARDRFGKYSRGKYLRQPVLFRRKNKSPWEVRTFAYLVVNDSRRVRVTVDINLPDFLIYFKEMIKFKLSQMELLMGGRMVGMNRVIDEEREVLMKEEKELNQRLIGEGKPSAGLSTLSPERDQVIEAPKSGPPDPPWIPKIKKPWEI